MDGSHKHCCIFFVAHADAVASTHTRLWSLQLHYHHHDTTWLTHPCIGSLACSQSCPTCRGKTCRCVIHATQLAPLLCRVWFLPLAANVYRCGKACCAWCFVHFSRQALCLWFTVCTVASTSVCVWLCACLCVFVSPLQHQQQQRPSGPAPHACMGLVAAVCGTECQRLICGARRAPCLQ